MRPWEAGEKRTSRMVFIGRDLDAELLKEVGARDGIHLVSTAHCSPPACSLQLLVFASHHRAGAPLEKVGSHFYGVSSSSLLGFEE